MKKHNTMKRLLAIAAAAALTLSLCACGPASEPGGPSSNVDGSAEPSQAVYSVAIIKQMDHPSLDEIAQAIEAELAQLAEDNKVTIQYHTTSGQGDQSTLKQLADQAIADGADVIVPIATPAVQAMLASVEDTDIPIIFSAVSDPIKDGIVADLNAPGGKTTGTSDALNTEMVMELMLAADPDIQKVGLLYSKSESSSAKPIEEAKAYLAAKGIAVEEKTGTNTNEISSAVDALVAAKVDAVFTPTDNTVQSAELAIFEKFQDARIPHYGGADSFALNGAFCGYGVDYVQLGQETARMVADLLVEGKDPASTPVRIMTAESAFINTETCAAIGMDLEQIRTAFSALGIKVVETTTQQSFS